MSTEERKTILLVGTEGSITVKLEKTLKQHGFDLIVKSPEDTVLFDAKDASIDLILVEIQEDDNSFTTKAAVTSAQKHDLPLICITAKTDPESISRIEKVTDYGYVATSWDDDFLIATLKHALLLFEARSKGKKTDRELKGVQWMLSKKVEPSLQPLEHQNDYVPKYGNLTSLNEDGLILTSVGEDVLRKIASEFYDLLDTSAAIYEKDGRYALGLFASSWCQFMDQASRDLCNTADNEEALRCGKWLCHESCWQKAALKAINTGKSADVKCAGGIHLYATPIRSGGEIIGAINFGYGDPPRDQATLKKLASKFKVPLQELSERAHSYKSRPNFMSSPK
jgi:AmiR/NasT family two-component response regulator/ligand-binding sensor protein